MFRKNVNEKVRGRKPLSKELTQLFLTVEELDTDIPTVLTTCNPYFVDDAVEFCYREGCYKQLQNRRSSIVFFSQKGNIKRKEEVQTTSGSKNEKEETVEELDTKRKNKFNFCDRATQTVNFLLKERANQTEPSSQLQFDGTVSAAEIALAYQEKEAGEKRDREEKPSEMNRKSDRKENKELIFSHHLKFLRFCERMVDQNLMSDISIDYSFYDTPSDEFKDKGLGSLLPLWKFNYQPMRGMAITGLSWNSRYSDMFAAAFGSHDVTMRHRSGCVCIFSLKCPSHPEKVISTKSGVCCVKFSPYRPHLLAVGLADGSVAVHDVRKAGSSPVAINKNSRLEHNDAVNQVKWLPDNIDGQPNFCSISADCKVINWILAKTELIPSEVLNLRENELLVEERSRKKSNFTSCGTCISFNPETNDLFLIGSENGLIQKYSNLSTAQYLKTYIDHKNVVYNVQWNPHHSRVFISCSADWTIRIWDHCLKESVFIFDLLNEVKDVTWAPFSSSLFAAVTNDGKVHVFDILLNRQQPTASYTLSSSKKVVNLTTVQFNTMKPIIIIGDDRGTVISFKLSPNLRSSLKVLQTTEKAKFSALESEKLEKVLKLARIPESNETITSE